MSSSKVDRKFVQDAPGSIGGPYPLTDVSPKSMLSAAPSACPGLPDVASVPGTEKQNGTRSDFLKVP